MDEPEAGAGIKRQSRPVPRANMVPISMAFDAEDHLVEDEDEEDTDVESESGSEFSDEEQTRHPAQALDVDELDHVDANGVDSHSQDFIMMTDAPVPEFQGSHQRRRAVFKGKGRATDGDTFEYEAEGFDRLISALRDMPKHNLQDASVQSARLGQQWDKSIEQELAELDIELEPGRAGRKKRRTAHSRGLPQLSPEVQNLLGQANLCYVSAKYDQAIDLLMEVIRIEPNCIQPWMTLAAIHTEIGEEEKALQFKVIGAHLQPKAGDLWKELAVTSRKFGLLSQAIYCYTQASRADRDDIDALWDRAFLHREMGNTRAAVTTLKSVLRILPHDPFIIRTLVEDYLKLNDVNSAVTLANSCLSHQRFENPQGPSTDPESAYVVDDLVTLTQLLVGLHRYVDAIRIGKTGQRWMQGREGENWWDTFQDDREYDIDREPGRMPPQEHAEIGEEVHPLDSRLRLVLGQSRLAGNAKDRREAQRHFDVLIGDLQVEDDPQMFGDIADAYFERKMWTEALDVFQKMGESDITSYAPVYAKMAQCHKRLGNYDDAIEIYLAVIENAPDDLDSKVQLAESYEQTGRRDLALELASAVIQARAERGDGAEEGHSGFATSQRRAAASRQRSIGIQAAVSRAQRAEIERQLQEDVQRAMLLLEENERKIADGEDAARREWKDIAQFLIDNFRESKSMFPSDMGKYRVKKSASERSQNGIRTGGDIDAYADDLVSRIQRSMVQEEDEGLALEQESELHSFRGISFDRWVLVALKYTCALALQGETEEGLEVLQHLLTSVLRLRMQHVQLLRLGIAAIALHSHNYALAVDEVRKFILVHPYQNPPLRLMQAVTPRGLAAAQVASSSIHQKFIMRQLKMIRNAVAKAEDDVSATRLAAEEDEEDPDDSVIDPALRTDDARDKDEISGPSGDAAWLPTKENPAYLAHYGNIMGGSKSYQAAIIYYLRAWELAPNDPLINLCLGMQYIQRAMQRQSDNRHHQISQGFAFLGRYRSLRGPCQEVEYNIGRAYHSIGLVDGAIKQYERVLELESQAGVDDHRVPQVQKSFARDAAYNLQLLYSTTGSKDLARAVVRRYLIF